MIENVIHGQGLPRAEILRSRKAIEQLFAGGTQIKAFPILMRWQNCELSETPVKVAFSVPKRNFKKAVDRNRIKRLMREAYRKNKTLLNEELKKGDQGIELMFIFVGREMPDHALTEEKIIKLLKRFKREE